MGWDGADKLNASVALYMRAWIEIAYRLVIANKKIVALYMRA